MVPALRRPLLRGLSFLGLVIASTLLPPSTPAGACDPGRLLLEAPYPDLGITENSPPAPELLSAVRVRPRSRIGCRCQEPCIEEPLVEFKVRSTAPWARITNGGRARYVERAGGSSEDEGLYYFSTGSLVGGPVEAYSIAMLDAEGNRSPLVSTRIDPDSEAEFR